MMRTLMALVAVGGLMLSTALARAQADADRMTNPTASQSSTSQASPTAPISQQSPDQWLASKLSGTDVIGTNDEKIGDVSDVLFDKSGKVNALIVGVGGFLGVGSKDVALPMSSFQVVPGSNGGVDKLRLSMTQDQLKDAAEFKPLSGNKATTGAGDASPARGASPMSPPASSR
jgi:sporulation protein YlmC with PRC-barrel domain